MKEIRIGAAGWGFREMDVPRQLDVVKELGLHSLELGIANAPKDVREDAAVEVLEQIRSAYVQRGISLEFAATGNDFTLAEEALVEADVKKVLRVVDICSFLGIRCLRIFAGFSPYGEVDEMRFQRMIRALNLVTRYGKDQGVTAAVETHGGVAGFSDGVLHFHSVTTEITCLERLVKETDESLKFVFDPANLDAIPGADGKEVLELLGPRISYVHVKDFVRLPGDHLRSAAMGEGRADWKGMIKQVLRWTGDLMIEYEETEDIRDGTRRSRDFLERILEEVRE